MRNDYLAHYGVKGMKWGVRKDRGSKGGGRRGSTMHVVGQAVGSGARKVGGAAAGGIKTVGKAAATVPSRVKAANAEKRRQEGIEAIRNGDTKTVEKNLKYLSSDDITTTLDRMNVEKKLMSEIAANQKKTGIAAVGDALKNVGDSRMGRAAQKGAAEGIQKVSETVVKGVANEAGGTAANAVGSGIAAAMTAYAMYRLNPDIGAPDYKKAFQSGAQKSLEKAAAEKFRLGSEDKDTKAFTFNTDVFKQDNSRAKKDTSKASQNSSNETRENPAKDSIGRQQNMSKHWSSEPSKSAVTESLKSAHTTQATGRNVEIAGSGRYVDPKNKTGVASAGLKPNGSYDKIVDEYLRKRK